MSVCDCMFVFVWKDGEKVHYGFKFRFIVIEGLREKVRSWKGFMLDFGRENIKKNSFLKGRVEGARIWKQSNFSILELDFTLYRSHHLSHLPKIPLTSSTFLFNSLLSYLIQNITIKGSLFAQSKTTSKILIRICTKKDKKFINNFYLLVINCLIMSHQQCQHQPDYTGLYRL